MAVEPQLKLPLLGTLPSHWRVVEFGSVLEEGGTRNGIYKKKEFHGSGDKIVNMGELFAHPRLFAVPMKRVQLSDNEQQRFRLQAGDLLFARRSLVAEGAGKCSVVCEINEPTTFESSIIRARPDQKIVDSFYLYYLFRSSYGTHILDTIRRQVAVSGITGTDLVKLLIPLPPLPEQKAIARILSSLDNKIELNQQMNQTLEVIARAIFKSWFVDFDPVRAKMDGRQPAGMDAATADLFPDAFEDSPLGKIPKGWRVGKIGEVIDISREGLNPSNYPDEIFEHYSLPAFDEGRLPKAEIGERIKSNKFIVPAKAVLLSKLNPHIPRIWLPFITKTHKSVCSTEFLVTMPKTGFSREYLYALFSSQSFLDMFSTLVTGTSGSHQRVKPEYLLTIEVLIPSTALISYFSELTALLYEKESHNLGQSLTLVDIRDTLLQKLLSGEMRVKEAKKFIEEKL